jgi:hypothetical protein
MTHPLATFPEFVEQVRARLAQGAREYGDRSFDRPISELLGEIEQELLDVCGWSFLLWCKLRALQAAAPVEEPRALAWLRERLASGPVELGALRAEAEQAGVKWREVTAARRFLKVKVEHTETRWIWDAKR